MLKHNKMNRQQQRDQKRARLEFLADVQANRIPAASPETIRMAVALDRAAHAAHNATRPQVNR